MTGPAVFLLLAAASTPGFADPGACRTHLEALVAEAERYDYQAIRGPYEVGPGDLRVHTVAEEGAGHRIVEHRCFGADFSTRSWHESMEGEGGGPAPFTVESVAARAPWFEKRRAE